MAKRIGETAASFTPSNRMQEKLEKKRLAQFNAVRGMILVNDLGNLLLAVPIEHPRREKLRRLRDRVASRVCADVLDAFGKEK